MIHCYSYVINSCIPQTQHNGQERKKVRERKKEIVVVAVVVLAVVEHVGKQSEHHITHISP